MRTPAELYVVAPGIENVVASGFHPALVPSCCSHATTTMRLFAHRGASRWSSSSAAHCGQVIVPARVDVTTLRILVPPGIRSFLAVAGRAGACPVRVFALSPCAFVEAATVRA